MKFLIIKNPYNTQPGGGGELHTLQLTKELQKRGHKVYYLGSCQWMQKMLSEEAGVPCFNFGAQKQEAVTERSIINYLVKHFKWKKEWQKKVLELKRELGVDTLYMICFNEKLLLTRWAKRQGMKVFWVEHRLMGRWFQLNPLRGAYIHSALKCDKIIAVSNAVKRGLLMGGVPNSRVQLIYNGIELENFLNIKKKAHKDIQIGTIARLSDDKGISYLINAFNRFQKDLPNSKLRIVGDGPLEKQLKAKVRKLKLDKKVFFEGRLSRKGISEFLSELDIFALLPTRGEAFGLVLAEASAVGLPCVVSKIGGAYEVIKNNETGIVVPPKNSIAPYKAFLKLAKDENLRKMLGSNARERAKEKFDIKRMLNEYLEVFTEDLSTDN